MDRAASTEKPHILIIGPGPEEVGGVSTFIQFIMCSIDLKRKFNLTHMYTSRGQNNQATAGRISVLNLSLLFRQVFRLFAVLSHQKPQVVHLNVTAGWSFWKSSVFMLVCRLFNVKTIAHIHGGDFNLFCDSSKPFVRRLIGEALRRADAIVVLSGWWRDYIQGIVKIPISTWVIPNAPDESFFASSNPDRASSHGAGNTIIFVGSIGRRKGVFDILNAIPLVIRDWESARFLFLGDEEIAGEKEQLRRISKQTGLERYVDFPGWVTGENKKASYQGADIFILPSYAENLPFSLLEAMATGLPVITTPVGGIPEIIEDGKNGFLIQPGNEGQLAGRILQLLRNPKLREELGKNAQQKINERFSPAKISQQWEDLYSQLSMAGRKPWQHLAPIP